jgi:hypothetical protein
MTGKELLKSYNDTSDGFLIDTSTDMCQPPPYDVRYYAAAQELLFRYFR